MSADPTTLSNERPGPAQAEETALSWINEDVEHRFGLFRGGRYTNVNKVLSFLIGTVLTTFFFAILVYGASANAWLNAVALPFIRPGNVWTTGPAMLLFFWSISILALKWAKLRLQARTLDLAVVPQQPEFVINETTARAVLDRLHRLVDHPRHFVLFNRIERALSNLHHLGGLNDVSTVLKIQSENDENQIASSYTLVQGMIWAIPVLGFIGTVRGLSIAISNFTATLQTSGDLASIKTSLQGVTSGLATAFETTLVALVGALVIQLVVSFLQQQESEFLDDCNDYCHAHVISRLRLNDDRESGKGP